MTRRNVWSPVMPNRWMKKRSVPKSVCHLKNKMMKNVATLKTGEFVFCRYTWRSGRGAPPTWGGASPTRGGAEEEESCQEKDQKLSMDECVWVEIVWMTAIVCVTLVDCPICVPLRGSFIFLPTPFSLRDLLYLKTGICWFVFCLLMLHQ